MFKKSQVKTFKKVVLIILDGWGIGQPDQTNAIYLANTPFIDSLYRRYPWTELCASGRCVGLPPHQPGNSEAGHINIGAGRVIDQDVVKISKQINTGEFFKNPAFALAVKHVKKQKSALHLMGLISAGKSPHVDPDHLFALLTMTRRYKIKNVYLHLFTDGRDSPPRSGLKAVEALERFLRPNEVIATIIGRAYAMDRKKNWASTWWAYEAMIAGKGHQAKSPQEGITRAYNADVTDEFIEPVVIYRQGKPVKRIDDHDAIIFFNLRSDRARQMAKPFVQEKFEAKNHKALKRSRVLKNIVFVALTDFGPDLDHIKTAYPAEIIPNTLPLLLKNKKQIYIAEKEKYAHVTYFINGGYADPIAGESRLEVPSPPLISYVGAPAMATPAVAQKVASSLGKYDFVCANISSPDMIGHTGNIQAGIRAAEIVDQSLKKIYQAARWRGAALIITADHGNLENMLNPKTKEVITEHSANPVPFILAARGLSQDQKLKTDGSLGNITPTILKLFGLAQTKEMLDSLI